jgi:hypothetical protein
MVMLLKRQTDAMKVGDLVRLKGIILSPDKSLGIVSNISQPTPMFPYQVVTVIFDGRVCEGISASSVEVVVESR